MLLASPFGKSREKLKIISQSVSRCSQSSTWDYHILPFFGGMCYEHILQFWVKFISKCRSYTSINNLSSWLDTVKNMGLTGKNSLKANQPAMTREHEVTETEVVSMSLYGAARSEDTSPTLTARKGCQSRFCDSSVFCRLLHSTRCVPLQLLLKLSRCCFQNHKTNMKL